jgi:hypothetical protein
MARKLSTVKKALLVAMALTLLLGVSTAQNPTHNTETTLFAFDLTHGIYPESGLVPDGTGNFYGTAKTGGLYPIRTNPCCGTVFELSPSSNGTWSLTVIYDFQGLADGTYPFGTMIIDKQGNLYGTTDVYALAISATVFELTKNSNGTWSEKTIYSFTNSDGNPNGDLTLDSEGNIYGTTQGNGNSGGEVFELSPQSDGTWKKSVPFTFNAPFPLGNPHAGVALDNKGNLYGTAYSGGQGYGGVYELSPQSNGQWKASVLFTFTGVDTGEAPNNKLIFDSSGNLYGLAAVVFELSPSSSGTWTEKIIHTFPAGVSRDAENPQGTLIFDASGNLYGTGTAGGLGCNDSSCGAVYELSPQSDGTWKETILHQFESAGDGSIPQAGLALDSAGNLFGTAKFGGSRYGYGTVFGITAVGPSSPAAP